MGNGITRALHPGRLRRRAVALAPRDATGDREEQFGRIPEYDGAISNGMVVFDHLLDARRGLNPPAPQADGSRGPDDGTRAALGYYLPRLWQSYERSHGRILECYTARNIAAGALITDKDELHIRYPPQSVVAITPAFEETLWSCSAQFREAREVLLPGGGRRILLTQIYSLLVYLLSVLDSQSAAGSTAATGTVAHDRIASALDTADSQLRRTRRDLNQFAQRDGQQLYLLGMAPGIGVLLALAFVTARARIAGIEVQPLLIALAAGGIGAVVSVMTRIMGPSLRFDYHAGNTLIVLAGVFRPVIGGIFGVALFVLLNAGLVQVAKVPDASSTRTYFFMGLAFLAGFSERWAHDILLLAGGGSEGGGDGGGSGRGDRDEPADDAGRPTPVSPPLDSGPQHPSKA